MYRRRNSKNREVVTLFFLSILVPCMFGFTANEFHKDVCHSTQNLSPSHWTTRESFLMRSVHSFLISFPFSAKETELEPQFVYSSDWTGTNMKLRSLEEAVYTADSSKSSNWPMARWPDPILRHPSSEVDSHYFGTDLLDRACTLLANTAMKEKAVGLAAGQCGVDARIIFLARSADNAFSPSLILVNPRIVARSPEAHMRVWKERCLVLPPTFSATVLRDDWVKVEFQSLNKGEWRQIRLNGEAARAFQHEFDHDRGILITDHIGYEEMESDLMIVIEARGHEQRMEEAYSRQTLPFASDDD